MLGSEPVAEALHAYIEAMTMYCPDFLTHFLPPAAPADIEALGSTLGFALPIQCARLLARHDGSGVAMVVPDFVLLPARGIAQEWRCWEDLRISEFDPAGLDCTPVGPVRGDSWWRPGWVPFAADGSGNFLCLDIDPAPGGAHGQVIAMYHDDDRRAVLAPSLDRWLMDLAADAREGRIGWDPDLAMAVRT